MSSIDAELPPTIAIDDDKTHKPKWAELGKGSLLDQIICSCGWESATYFDGQVYAHSQWKRHVEAVRNFDPRI